MNERIMSKINQDELFQHLSGFLKSKGIELQEGSYSTRIRKGCGLLTETINLTQETLGRAKSQVDAKLERMRQVIHEKTAPKTANRKAGSGNPGRKADGAAQKAGAQKTGPRKPRARKAGGASGRTSSRRKV